MDENVWLPKHRKCLKEEAGETAELKKIRGYIMTLLNRMVPENFKCLTDQILQLNIDNIEKMELLVDITFKKAISEPLYTQTYAKFSQIAQTVKFPEEQHVKDSPFTKMLLNRCQKEFFRERSEEDRLTKRMEELLIKSITEKSNQIEELLYQRSKLKKKMLGNINFIGELYNLGMVSSDTIICQFIKHLLDKKEQGKMVDDDIECLATLFSTVGLKLEKECDNDEQRKAFEESFVAFKDLGSNSNYTNRIRFMIQDVVELRENNWVPRRVEAKPQRIEDIHREHAREEQEKKMEAALATKNYKREKKERKERQKRIARTGSSKIRSDS